MSLMIEVASFLGGAMSEYAQRKCWGSIKIFIVTSSIFFMLFSIYFILFPPAKGLSFGVSGSAILALILGLINVVFIRHAIKRKNESSRDHG
jgi:hypothetical protein